MCVQGGYELWNPTIRRPSRLARRALTAAVVSVAALLVPAVPFTAMPFGTLPFGALAPAAAADQPPVDVGALDLVPLVMDGVAGVDPLGTQTPTIENQVWDIQQAGRRIFVGGAFLSVQQGKTATPVGQPFLAAFDLDTGKWVDSCRPTFDRAVYALERSPDGLLLVGGEFETVNGTPRRGLVALDPATCQTAASFAGATERPYSENRAMVRALELVGDDLYVSGNFSHLTGPNGQRVRLYKAGRMNSRTGTVDPAFAPAVTGSGVWGMAVDPQRGRVHLTGFFSGVNGTASSGYFHTVDTATGASVPGLTALPRNYPRTQPEMYDVAMGKDAVFVAGEQHIVQVLDADTHRMTAYSYTGANPCAGQTFTYCGSFAGGAYQFAERIGDVVFAGCHCTYATRNGNISHFNSVTGQRTPNKLTMAYDAATGRLFDEFRPDLDGSKDGSWAAASDTNGCLYLGGDYKVGGVAAGRSRWVGGFAKFCPRGWIPPLRDSTAPSVPTGLEGAAVGADAVQLAWNPATDNVAVTGYRVLRDGVAVGEVSEPGFAESGLTPGSTYRFAVVALDGEGNLSAPSSEVVVTLEQGAGDNQAPTVPTDLAARAGAGSDVALTWTASTDNVAVASYLVYRDGAYVGWSATPAFTDPGAGAGPFQYTVRAIDAIGNRSLRSEPAAWSAAGVDSTAPSMPTGLAASDAGGGTVRLTWTASTDNVAVTSYLVYRGGAYIGWSATASYTDPVAPIGTASAYQVRALDKAGNRSDKSAAVSITPR